MNPIEITAPEDLALLKNAEGLSVGGNIILPSGLKIPNPPTGYRWVVHTEPSVKIYQEQHHELE